MSTNNICFHGEIRKISKFLTEKSILSKAMIFFFLHLFHKILSGMANRVDPDQIAPEGKV